MRLVEGKEYRVLISKLKYVKTIGCNVCFEILDLQDVFYISGKGETRDGEDVSGFIVFTDDVILPYIENSKQ